MKLKINFLCIFVMVLGASPRLYGETIQLRYADLPRLIQEKNGAVLASEVAVDSSKERTGFLNRSFLPKLEAKGGIESFKTGTYSPKTQPYGGLEVSVNVFHGGKDRLEEESRQSQVTVSQAKKDKVLREELLTVRLLYWDLVYQREKIRMLNGVHQLNAESRKSAQLRVQKGLATNTEVLAMNLFASQIKEEVASSTHEIQLLESALATRLGFSPAIRIQTLTQIPHGHDHLKLKGIAIISHPEVELLKTQSKLNQIEAKKLSRWWAPSVDVYGKSYLYTLQDRDFTAAKDRVDTGLGIRLHSTLFDGFHSKREVQSETGQAFANEKMAQYKNNLIHNDAELAQEELRHLHQLTHNSQDYLKQAKLILEQTFQEYDLGLKDSRDILSTVDRFLSLRQSDLQRRLEYQKINVKLLALLGQ